MALANSLLCSSSSFSHIHYRYRDFNYAPRIFSQPEPSSLAFSPIRNKFSELGNGMSGFSKKKNIVHASANDLNASASSSSLFITTRSSCFVFFPLSVCADCHLAYKPAGTEVSQDADSVPIPVVLINQDSDSDATIVQLSFGDRLGALINTGTVLTEGPVKQTKFFITRLDSGRKVEDPDMLERIRLTIINNLLKYHPESSERLAMGEAFGIKAPEKKLDVDFATRVHVKEDGPKRSLLCIETADRPGLLVEIIKVIADVNIDVESAEIDTEGLIAKDKFHVSYRGASLNSSLSQGLVNCLRYYLGRPETDTDSY
ncbi:ACT DOMAIN-CONTAINING PROTEIN ACR4-RELATED [Salix koriyanagi]|uniref:ACT domain-containing protein ACR n=1 Tax=Salix koriyanagi TaxID=2511006 RepID=A0A9Q0WKN0_9ROSI|nr:ACT DOMAIN-CONTAINING PROTEIN ACR4-RELATED [Salix koriyanagi]